MCVVKAKCQLLMRLLRWGAGVSAPGVRPHVGDLAHGVSSGPSINYWTESGYLAYSHGVGMVRVPKNRCWEGSAQVRKARDSSQSRSCAGGEHLYLPQSQRVCLGCAHSLVTTRLDQLGWVCGGCVSAVSTELDQLLPCYTFSFPFQPASRQVAAMSPSPGRSSRSLGHQVGFQWLGRGTAQVGAAEAGSHTPSTPQQLLPNFSVFSNRVTSQKIM